MSLSTHESRVGEHFIELELFERKKCHQRKSDNHVKLLFQLFRSKNPNHNGLAILECDYVAPRALAAGGLVFAFIKWPALKKPVSVQARTQSFTGGGRCRSELSRRKRIKWLFPKSGRQGWESAFFPATPWILPFIGQLVVMSCSNQGSSSLFSILALISKWIQVLSKNGMHVFFSCFSFLLFF